MKKGSDIERTRYLQRFLFQSIIAIIECLERDDWDVIKLDTDTDNDNVDIWLYKDGAILSVIQVKSK